MASDAELLPDDVIRAGLGDDDARLRLVENMATAYIGSLLFHDTERPASMITGFRGLKNDPVSFQIQVVGEWFTVRLEHQP